MKHCIKKIKFNDLSLSLILFEKKAIALSLTYVLMDNAILFFTQR